ncbi:MAG: nitroreductase family protein [Spirochaetae bacterium HGW-Spirochaetae-1]|jgi:nitroreductase|nr:MAG: nitroreductase family protein [Spirochaetae bacterium HGW-Spirochaetae-1]
MEYGELLKNRRSIRNFTDRSVTEALLMDIITESTLAPNASHAQQWRFVIVNNKDMMKRISDESKKNILQRIMENPEDTAHRYEAVLRNENYNVFYNAPALIIICGPVDYRNTMVDCALCAGYLMNAAVVRGLGTCWVNLGFDVRDPGLRSELGLFDDMKIVAPIIIGYPESIPPVRRREPPVVLKIIR